MTDVTPASGPSHLADPALPDRALPDQALPDPAPARSRNKRGEGERLREELLDAAVGLLSEAAHPDDVSIRAIARAAGVSPTAAYRHFEDRDDLVCEAVGACYAEFAEDMLRATAGIADPFERLRLAGRAYLEYAHAEHGHYRVLFSNPVSILSKSDDEELAGKAAFAQLVAIVQACLDAGAPTRTQDAEFLSFQVWTWIHGIVDLRITHPMMDWPDAEQMFEEVQVALGLVHPT
jgi:AcrR family transcriptional regulator